MAAKTVWNMKQILSIKTSVEECICSLYTEESLSSGPALS